MRPGASAIERFTGWYVRAIDKLRELPEGDGGFAVLMIAFPLYERLIVARLKAANRSTEPESIRDEIASDLVLDQKQRSVFWAVFRVGFTHQAMGQIGQTQWLVSDRFGAKPTFRELHGQSIVCLDPWKFADRVVKEFLDNPLLIELSESFPLAQVFAISAGEPPR